MIAVEKINLTQKFSLFKEYWSPKIVGELNDSYIKLAKLKGGFDWHHHDADRCAHFPLWRPRLLTKTECQRDSWEEIV